MNDIITENWIVAVALIWTIPWKGVALWRAARNNDKGWFIFFVVVSTFALLEAAYIFHFSDRAKVKRGKKGDSK